GLEGGSAGLRPPLATRASSWRGSAPSLREPPPPAGGDQPADFAFGEPALRAGGSAGSSADASRSSAPPHAKHASCLVGLRPLAARASSWRGSAPSLREPLPGGAPPPRCASLPRLSVETSPRTSPSANPRYAREGPLVHRKTLRDPARPR